MSTNVLILGDSGTGKSTSIRTLPSQETFILNVIGKPLPFRGANKKYKKLSADGKEGNYYSSDNAQHIKRIIQLINQKRDDIKYLILDDCGYVIMNDFMKKSLEKGYEKYNTLGKEFSDIINSLDVLRDDLFCFVMMHVETDNQGKTKPKTVGKMIDQYICIEGKFSYVLHTLVMDGNYKFITNNDGFHMCKTPMELFDDLYIDNDLLMVSEKIKSFINEEIDL
jgi:hypothetical protein